MFENFPSYINFTFAFTTLLTVFIFYYASGKAKKLLIIAAGWLLLQEIVSFSGFYTVTNTLPPRFILLPLPPVILIIVLFATAKGRAFLDRFDLKLLTILHTVRIPVELVLLWLWQQGKIPQLMTFEGRNFDILSGITAPVMVWLCFGNKPVLGRKALLVWNFICLGLLINIVANAALSVPFPFQKFAFEQPNIAVLYFPFVWLPCCVVPIVLLSHLISIRKLLKQGEFSIKQD